jgi:UDP-N-acetylglucosamine/UDP-N-acetylgalactosamine diphosphorylase
MTERLEKARRSLDAVNQGHVLADFESLSEEQRTTLLKQIEGVDWPEVGRLIETHVKRTPEVAIPDNIEPAPYYPIKPGRGQKDKYRKARKQGEKLIAAGKVAAFTVAGGQGTRLGWPGPKGTYPATPIKKTPLFCCLADFIRKAQQKYDCVIPWYVMTSPENDAPTRAFFEQHGYFGLEPANVMMFPQAMMPAIDMKTAKVLMADRDKIALSPNGHGGSLKALYASGALADMRKRGIKQISYTQIDNPLVKVIDPLFIGLHALDGAQMSSKMVAKTSAKEKVGVFCLADGKISVIEYSSLPDELAEQTDDQGQLRFLAGSIAIHVMRVDFVESLNKEGFGLPFNRAEKKVAYLDRNKQPFVEPKQANAIKLETFVFDALPMCEKSIILETDRVEEFAPIKNADDPDPDKCVDSPLTSMRIQSERAARWLEANKVQVARDDAGHVDAVIELSHLTAIEPADLKRIDLPDTIERDTQVLL